MNFKELIIFDLVLLRLTELSVIAHDSNIFKNIADLPIDKIMELYNQSEKQIFIAFDKEDTFYDVTMEENYLDGHGQRKQQERNQLLQKLV
jgi:hypothetical protein